MAAFDTTVPASFTGRIGQAFAALTGTVANWNDARLTRNALSDLNDRELEDIGLSRGDISNIR